MQELGVTQTTAVLRVYLNEYLRWFTDELEAMTDGILAAEADFSDSGGGSPFASPYTRRHRCRRPSSSAIR